MPETLTEVMERVEQDILNMREKPGVGYVVEVRVSDLRLLITALERALDM